MSTDAGNELLRLRQQLDQLDSQLLDLVSARCQVIAAIGEVKRGTGRPLRDFKREKEVLDLAAANAESRGLDQNLAHTLMKLLIQHSLATQENEQIRAGSLGDGKQALVIGGAGQMGRWFARFLDAQGYSVEIADPAVAAEDILSADGFKQRKQFSAGALDHELILVAASIQASQSVMLELAQLQPAGVVIDVASVKAPLRSAYTALQQAGVAVASLHPLFGPSTMLLADRHVAVMDLGSERATTMARSLFAATSAQIITMSIDEHDRLMAEVLGISHAINIVFGAALAAGDGDKSRLERISSSTFDAQTRVTQRVVNENPALYFEIQRLNPHSGEALERLNSALNELRAALAANDAERFSALMRSGQKQLDGINKEWGRSA